jgi:transposase
MVQDAMPLDAPLPDDPVVLQAMIRDLLATLKDTRHELDGVRHRLDLLLKRLYGPKAERFDPNQPSLFDGCPPPPVPELTPAPPDEPEAMPHPKKKKGHGRKPLPEHLRRERKECDLSDAEKLCPCCRQPRIKIGEEVSEQLDYEPASLFIRERVRFKYACPSCLKEPPTEAPLSPVGATLGSELSPSTDATEAPGVGATRELELTPNSNVTEAPATTAESELTSPGAAELPATRPTSDSPLPRCAGGAEPVPVGTPLKSWLPPSSPMTEPPPLIVTAPMPKQPLPKSIAGPGLLAHLIVSKYLDHLPLHRLEGIFSRQGVDISRKTMCDWMAGCASLLTPLYELLKADLLRSQVINTDDTRVPVQEPGLNRTKSGRLWVYIGDRNHPWIIYDYTPTHSRDGPAAFLKDYRSYLQADAATLYDRIYQPGAITELGCMAHGRRHFYEARTSDAVRAHEALGRIRCLYAVEDEAKEQIAAAKLSDAAADALRLRLRQEKTAPLLSSMYQWLQEQQASVLPKSPMGYAIAYALRHWQALTRFTEHGWLSIDNNAAERALRGIAVGRKNWLFAGSDEGGKTAAVLYSIATTCKSLGIEPFGYLRDILTRLPEHPAARLPELFPTCWATAQRQQAETPA